MRHYGIVPTHARGVSVPVLRVLARTIGRNQKLSLEHWPTGVLEARVLASLIGNPLQGNGTTDGTVGARILIRGHCVRSGNGISRCTAQQFVRLWRYGGLTRLRHAGLLPMPCVSCGVRTCSRDFARRPVQTRESSRGVEKTNQSAMLSASAAPTLSGMLISTPDLSMERKMIL
jgi:hypothetical protein